MNRIAIICCCLMLGCCKPAEEAKSQDKALNDYELPIGVECMIKSTNSEMYPGVVEPCKIVKITDEWIITEKSEMKENFIWRVYTSRKNNIALLFLLPKIKPNQTTSNIN